MPKLSFVYNLNNEDLRLFRSTAEVFKKHGILLTTNFRESDYVFYASNLGYNYYSHEFRGMWDPARAWSSKRDFDNILSLVKTGKKVIMYHRSDGADNLDDIFTFIKSENIADRIILLKDFNFSPDRLSSKFTATQDNGRHYYHLTKIVENLPDSKAYTKFPITTVELNESYIPYYKNVNLFTYQFKPYGFHFMGYERNISNKTIDIFCIKNMRNTLDGYMRAAVKDCVIRIPKYVKCTDNCSKPQYMAKLTNSKLSICTWGYGECLTDDFTSILNEVVVLKPDTSHARDYYRLYERPNEMLVYYKPDLSDLHEKIAHVLDNYSQYRELAKAAKAKLLEYSLDRHAYDLCNIINSNLTLAR